MHSTTAPRTSVKRGALQAMVAGSSLSSSSNSKQVGGEYGEVRATFDVSSLNAYLKESVKRVKAPVQVKQFKVRMQYHVIHHVRDT